MAGNGDTIDFASGISTITLTSGQIDIDKNLTINGPGADKLTISGNGASRVFNVWPDVEVTINGISFTGGYDEYGGVIYNGKGGIITITSCTLFFNTATQFGGAVYNGYKEGAITIINSTLFDNTAAADGGAIYNYGSLTITGSTISGNSTTGDGGAIYNVWSGMITITSSTLSGNMASNNGGAIYNGYAITITIISSTLSGNSAGGEGGAIYSHGIFTITNSTLSQNSATIIGGAIFTSAGVLNVSFSTIAENQASNGASIYNDEQSSAAFKNSIVANNKGANYSGSGTISVSGVNFDTDGTFLGFTHVTSDALKLGLLALNSPGTTETHALLRGSVAIDIVTDCTDIDGNVVTTDQRGVSRPQKRVCDAGAYEVVADPCRAGVPCRGLLFADVSQYGFNS